MKITLIFIGKTSSKEVDSLFAEYISRIKRHEVSTKIIPYIKKKLPREQQKEAEGALILKELRDDDFLVLLDEKGKEFTSVEFAAWIERREMQPQGLVFVVGGAYGFSTEVYARSNFKVSLSQMTFSHQLIRAIFAEQLYRAVSIIEGLPYHHE